MATDVTALYNMALDVVGARARISLPSEDSREAEACDLWFPNIRDQVLASAPWPEATKMERLALLAAQEEETWVQGAPRPDLLNAFALPSDCLRPQYLSGFGKFVVQHYDEESRALMTNDAAPILIYTFRQELVPFWSQELQMAITYGLAGSICSSLTGKTSRAKMLIQQANAHIISARETAANTNDERFDSLPDWIAARGFTDASSNTRYLYPYGSLLSVSNVS